MVQYQFTYFLDQAPTCTQNKMLNSVIKTFFINTVDSLLELLRVV